MIKKFTLFFLLLISFAGLNFASATIVIIQAIGTSSATDRFNPQVAMAVCGDTITWIKVSGTHTTASTTIPAGALSWDSPNITTAGFSYIATVPGTYNYTCHPNTGGHMDASFEVSCGTQITPVDLLRLSSIYPVPASGRVTINMGNATNGNLEVYSVSGEKVLSLDITGEISEADLKISEGIYFYKLIGDGDIIGKGKLILN